VAPYKSIKIVGSILFIGGLVLIGSGLYIWVMFSDLFTNLAVFLWLFGAILGVLGLALLVILILKSLKSLFYGMVR